MNANVSAPSFAESADDLISVIMNAVSHAEKATAAQLLRVQIYAVQKELVDATFEAAQLQVLMDAVGAGGVSLMGGQDAEKVGAQPHYVIRFDEEINGLPGDVYGLVRVDEWNNGLSRAIANLINYEDGDPIIVYTAPAQPDQAQK